MRSLPASHCRFSLAAGLIAMVLVGLLPAVASPTPAGSDRPLYRSQAAAWAIAPVSSDSLSARRTVDGGVDGVAPGTSRELGSPGVERTGAWSFAANVRVHPAESGEHIWSDIALAPDGTLAVAWMDDHAAGGYHIYYSSSGDQGATWSVPERVDDRAAGSYSKFVSLGFTPAGLAVAAWEDDRSGVYNVYFAKRDPEHGGSPWTPNARVNTAGSPPSGSDFMNASLAILDEGRYFIAWADWREGVFYQVYQRGTRDGGLTWGDETRVSDGLGYQPVAGDPSLIVDPDSGPAGQEILYCVTNDWRGNVPGGRYPNVYFYRSTNGGASWTTGVCVNDITDLYQQVTSRSLVQLGDGRLACGWLNNPDWTQHHLRVCVSSDGGATWRPSQQVDEASSGGTDGTANLSAQGSMVFAVFGISEQDWNVYVRASADGGVTWDEPMARMDDDVTGAAAGRPVVVVASAELIHAAWDDTRAPGYNWKTYATTGTRASASVPWNAADGGLGAGGLRASPNPAPPGARVELWWPAADLGTAGSGREIDLFHVSGRHVRTLRLERGWAAWDGRDERGRAASAGTYVARLRGAGASTRLIRLR
jgi:hypothetical protein